MFANNLNQYLGIIADKAQLNMAERDWHCLLGNEQLKGCHSREQRGKEEGKQLRIKCQSTQSWVMEKEYGPGSGSSSLEWAHTPTSAMVRPTSSPPSAALHPRGCSGWFSGAVSQQGSPRAAKSTTTDSLVSAAGDSPASVPQALPPSSAGAIPGQWFPASCQNQGAGTPCETQDNPTSSCQSPLGPRAAQAPLGSPCPLPGALLSDAEAVTAISLLISNLSAPKHAWTDISVHNWEKQDLFLCKELLFQGCAAEGGGQQAGRGSGYITPWILERRKSL